MRHLPILRMASAVVGQDAAGSMATERIVTKEPVRETLMNHLRLLDQQGKRATASIEGRITIVEEGQAPEHVPQDNSSRRMSQAGRGIVGRLLNCAAFRVCGAEQLHQYNIRSC